MLHRLQRFLRQRRQACVADIAAALQVDESAVQGMLQTLQRRGRVQRVRMPRSLCGACTRCAPDTREEWRWIADAQD